MFKYNRYHRRLCSHFLGHSSSLSSPLSVFTPSGFLNQSQKSTSGFGRPSELGGSDWLSFKFRMMMGTSQFLPFSECFSLCQPYNKMESSKNEKNNHRLELTSVDSQQAIKFSGHSVLTQTCCQNRSSRSEMKIGMMFGLITGLINWTGKKDLQTQQSRRNLVKQQERTLCGCFVGLFGSVHVTVWPAVVGDVSAMIPEISDDMEMPKRKWIDWNIMIVGFEWIVINDTTRFRGRQFSLENNRLIGKIA